jgi:hypothetical protein
MFWARNNGGRKPQLRRRLRNQAPRERLQLAALPRPREVGNGRNRWLRRQP